MDIKCHGELAKVSRLVGETMASFFARSIYQTDEMAFFATRALIDAGVFDVRGDLNNIWRAEVRLPQR
jgi:hypothetical protein